MVFYFLRGAFILLVAAVTALYLLPNQMGISARFSHFVIIMAGALGVAAFVIAVDIISGRKKLAAVSGVFLGLIAGLIAAWALSFVVNLAGLLAPIPSDLEDSFKNLLEGVKVIIGLITCYVCISLVLQTKDDFRFIIPYVEFVKQIRGYRPTLLDTSVIIDGRILDVVQTQVLQGSLIVPKFVLNEIQTVADSADKLRRQRGRRGLEILQKLQNQAVSEVNIQDADAAGSNVDQKLVALAQQMKARVMTNDYNLTKVANLSGVDVINLNSLAKALRPVVLAGETMRVKIVKYGEGTSQGVGYLEDGTMVVVEEARSHMGQEVELVVTSTLQTSAGRMIFGRFRGPLEEEAITKRPDPKLDAVPVPAPAAAGHALSESQATTPPAAGLPARHRPKHASSAGRNPRRH